MVPASFVLKNWCDECLSGQEPDYWSRRHFSVRRFRFQTLVIETHDCPHSDGAELMSDLYGEISYLGCGESYGCMVAREAPGKRYYWLICACGKTAGHYFKARIPFANSGNGWIERHVLGCCQECVEKNHGIKCVECQKYSISLDKWSSFVESECVARLCAGDHIPYVAGLFCSPECCSLAIRRVQTIEREQRKIAKEIRCVQEVQALMAKARRAMQRNDLEAFPMLKREFARVATSRE